MLSVSERLSSIKLKAPLQFLDGLFLLPKSITKNTLASCTTSVYVNLSKNSFLTPDFSKAGAKVRTFSEPTKLLRRNFHLLCKNLVTLDEYQDAKWATPYYNIKGRGNEGDQGGQGDEGI